MTDIADWCTRWGRLLTVYVTVPMVAAYLIGRWLLRWRERRK